MPVNIRRLFKKNAGSGSVFISGALEQRGEHNTVAIVFEMVPEGRRFHIDGVLHEGATDDEMLQNAVLKIAAKAKHIRDILAAPDGTSSIQVNAQRVH